MSHPVLVVGESLVDVVTTAGRDGSSTVERPGGSAANVAVALARLGHAVRFATALARDPRGAAIAEHLQESGVRFAADPYVLDRTSTAHATIGADGSASYVFDLEWRLPPVPDDVERAAAFVHVCSIGAVLAPGADDVLALVQRASARGAVVTYDVNARPSITGDGHDLVAGVEAIATHADLVKASDEDLAVLYPTLALDEAAEALRARGPGAVVVTRGGDGLSWYAGGEPIEQPAAASRVADTIGAGDTVSAALLDALAHDLDPESTLEHAARAAAVTVSRPGADPPWRRELGPLD